MNLYKVVSGVLVVGAGQVAQLTKEQAAPRHHKLKPLAGERLGAVEAIAPPTIARASSPMSKRGATAHRR